MESSEFKYKMKVGRYTDEIQAKLNTKTKPEPWLHIAIAAEYHPDNRGNGEMEWAIYVWDTREVIESGSKSYHVQGRGKVLDLALASVQTVAVKDNKEDLAGKAGNLISRSFYRWRRTGKPTGSYTTR